MILRLYCSSKHIPSGISYNNGIEEVMYLLWLVNQSGTDVEIIDTTRMSAQAVQAAYENAQIPSIAKKLSIRRVFGSKTRSGFQFGKEVPALIVYNEKEYPVDVYPYHKGIHEETTIRQYLFGLLPDKQSYQLLERWITTRVGFGYYCGHDLLEFKLDYERKRKPKRRTEQ